VTVMTVGLLMVIVVPLLLAIVSIISRVDEISAWVKSLTAFTVPPPPEWVGKIPLAGPGIVERWNQYAALGPEEISARLAPFARQALGWFVAKAGSIGLMVLEFLLTVIIAAILYANGETAAAGVRSFARRLGGQQGENAVLLAAKAVRGVAMGVVITAIVQATVGGIGLAVTGVPAAALLTAVMFMFCLAQIGPALVLFPAVAWLYWKAGALWGTILLVISIFAGTLDNFLRPLLVKKSVDLPLVLIFAGVIGGLIAFGIIGLFIGPVVLAVTYTLLKEWTNGNAPEEKVVTGESEESL